MVEVLKVRNVCEALPVGIELLRSIGTWEETRAGRALVAPCPVAKRVTMLPALAGKDGATVPFVMLPMPDDATRPVEG